WVGYYTDRHPNPLVLPVGSICTLVGIVMILLLAYVSYRMLGS
ncbi:fosmidomycin resistance protein, partial [Pseudomonas amygdali pv. mori str. 301020]